MDIKNECERILTICQGCLSADRQLACITGQNRALFVDLREDAIINEKHSRDLLLCWECVALLNKLKQFQTRIKTAQYRLELYLQAFRKQDDIPQTLSLLSKSKNEKYDYNYQYYDHKDLSLAQNDLTYAQNTLTKDENIYLDQKEETKTQNLLQAIKTENNDEIKEEYYDNISVNNDEDYYDTELKQEHTELTIVKKKQTQRKQSIRKYEQHVTVTKIHASFTKTIELNEHYDIIHLSSKEIDDICRGRFDRGTKLPYKCKLCNIGFRKLLDLLRHKTLMHWEPNFPTACLLCKDKILSQSSLEDHWKEYHNIMLRCIKCGQLSRNRGELTKHLNRSHTKSFTCNSCLLKFGTLREFSKHYNKMHERAICDYCNKNCPSKRNLEVHIKRNHLKPRCTICIRDFSSYHTFESHLREFHPDLLPSRKTTKVNEEERYCVECDKLYPSIYKYKRHLQQSVKHTPPKKIRVPCPSCDKVFSRVSNKNNHYRLMHLKKTNHYCEPCNKYFAKAFGLRKHISCVHKKIPMPKDKICDLCGRGFSSNRILTNHRRTHTGERPYKCDYCPASFAQQTAMKCHQKTQHNNVVLPTCNKPPTHPNWREIVQVR